MRITFCLCLLFVCASLSVRASDDSSLAHYLNFETFEAHFVQETRTSAKEGRTLIMQGQGHLLFKKPSYFRWVLKSPDPIIIVGDGRQVWHYDKDLEQVSIQSYAKTIEQNKVFSLFENMNESNMVDKRQCGKDVDHCYFIESTALWVGIKGGLLHLLKLKDALEQETRLVFSAQKINLPLNDAVFVFKQPAGVEVIPYD
jgi:outer membrane lipoprotein carrier protein